MSGNERLDSKAGPLGNLSQAYFGGIDNMVKGCEPALKGVGRWNLELFGLMTRRSQAWLEMPARLGRCKTPVEAYGEQMRFWQTAAADYADGWQRLAAAWGACAVMPKLNGSQPRDYMAVAEPKDAAAADKRGERKAA
ncbi:MAG: hypothetical protein ACAH24_02105 [Hyphomicrobiaceae bacterium]|jgi:hypothetical protein